MDLWETFLFIMAMVVVVCVALLFFSEDALAQVLAPARQGVVSGLGAQETTTPQGGVVSATGIYEILGGIAAGRRAELLAQGLDEQGNRLSRDGFWDTGEGRSFADRAAVDAFREEEQNDYLDRTGNVVDRRGWQQREAASRKFYFDRLQEQGVAVEVDMDDFEFRRRYSAWESGRLGDRL